MFVCAGVVNISTGELLVSDMRSGPTEDGCLLRVAPGRYLVTRDVKPGGVEVYRVALEDAEVKEIRKADAFSTEMRLIGCFDRAAVLEEFGSFEALFEWGSSEVGGKSFSSVFNLVTPAGLILTCLPMGAGGEEVEVSYLYDMSELVGCELCWRKVVEERSLSNTDDLYKFEFFFGDICLDLYASTLYDDESISDSLIDSINDLFADNSADRIRDIFDRSELQFDMYTSLVDYDKRFASLDFVKIYSVSVDGKESLLRVVEGSFLGFNNISLCDLSDFIKRNMRP